MAVDYQAIVDLIVTLFTVVLPIALIFGICDKITDFFLSFVLGKRAE